MGDNNGKSVRSRAYFYVPELERLLLGNERVHHASHDLWTHLPSYEIARRFHGDYADDFKPSPEHVMQEAAEVLWALANGGTASGVVFWSEQSSDCFDGCPCGERHSEV